MAWIPIANIVLMCRIAGKSGWWTLLVLIPLVNIVVGVVIWIGIARARGKSPALLFLFLIPVVGILVPVLLAMGDPTSPATPAAASVRAAQPAAPLRPSSCPSCNSAIEPDALFCGECGTNLPQGATAPRSQSGPVLPSTATPAAAKTSLVPVALGLVLLLATAGGGWWLFSRSGGGGGSADRTAPALPQRAAGALREFPVDNDPVSPAQPTSVIRQSFTADASNAGAASSGQPVPDAWLPPGLPNEGLPEVAEAVTSASYRTAPDEPPVLVHVLETAPGADAVARQVAERVDEASAGTAQTTGVEVTSPDGDVYEGYRVQTPETAAEGATFRRTTAQATWTKVSTPSTMTSLYPLSHGVRDFADRLPAGAETLAEQYRAAGYATLAYSSVLFTGQFTNMHQGFEELHESGSADLTHSSKTAREYVDRLSEWLGTHRDVPFFVFLHVFDPHDPFEPREPYATMWADPAHKAEHEEQLEAVREHIEDQILRQFGMPDRRALEAAEIDPEAYVDYDQDWYDGSIRGMDVELGRLTERLRTLGLDDDTLIVFMSDHGEEFLEHGRMFHGQTVYNELTQVPLVMRWPGAIPSGVVVDENVQLIDIMPTLLDLSGLPHPEGLQGRSLLPFVAPADAGTVASWVTRPAFSEKALTSGNAVPPADTESYAVIDDDWLLIHNRARDDDTLEFELYDVSTDPLNLTNVAEGQTEVVERLAREIDRWHRIAEQARLPDDAESAAGLSQEELERLRSLGYIR